MNTGDGKNSTLTGIARIERHARRNIGMGATVFPTGLLLDQLTNDLDAMLWIELYFV